MSNNQFHSTNALFRQVYHQADLDKAAPNVLQGIRDNNNNYNHNITRKGGFKTPVPIYKFDSVHNSGLQNVKRFADERHRVKENRNQSTFNRTHHVLQNRPFQ